MNSPNNQVTHFEGCNVKIRVDCARIGGRVPVVVEGVWFTACRAYLRRSVVYYALSINIFLAVPCGMR